MQAAHPAPPSKATAAGAERHPIVIVGTGFAGLCMGIRLKQAGIDDFVLLEREAELGGVWRDNVYPGVACDIESNLYSFSFEPNPAWSRMYGPQPEILAYLNRCADRYGLRPHIRFRTAAVAASFDERSGLWTVQTSGGGELRARVLISGSGHALTRPVYPDIPGISAFTGKSFHSSRWDHDFPLAGKSVAVIGTGASAIQIIPAIAPAVARMHVFQRTAPWVVPKADRPMTPREQARFERAPWLQRLHRAALYWRHELFALGFVVDPRINELAGRLALRYLEACVPDAALRERLTPDYTLGCKRVLLSNDYYQALGRPNVELVTEGIAEIRPRSIVTRDGQERPVDAIVYATGFEAAEAAAPFELRGRGGRDLNAAWGRGIEAHLGCAIAGFPNLFLLLGPNTGLGHSSMVFMIESQVAYILDAIKAMRAEGLAMVDVLPGAQVRYNGWLQSRLARAVWSTGCQSWYLTRSGKNTTAWPGFTFEFRLRTRRFDRENYERRPHDPADAAAEQGGAIAAGGGLELG